MPTHIRLSTFLLFLFCNLVVMGAPNPGQEAAEDYFAFGMRLVDEGSYRYAAEAFSKAIDLNPRYAAAYYNRGLLTFTGLREREVQYGWPGEVVEASTLEDIISDYSKAIEIDPRYAPAYLGRGTARERKGDRVGALADYSKAIRFDPHMAEAYHYRGDARLLKKDLAGALSDYDKALELRPDYALLHINRGYARAESGNLNGAMDDFNRAIAIDPELALGYSNRGLVKLRLGMAPEAQRDFDVALQLEGRLKPILDAEIAKIMGKSRGKGQAVNRSRKPLKRR